VGAAIWGSRRKSEPGENLGDSAPGAAPSVGRGAVQVSRPLCVATLIWIVFLLAIISIPRSAWINSVATLAALGVGACWYFWGRPRGPVDAQGPD
jgi:hypothetical protein